MPDSLTVSPSTGALGIRMERRLRELGMSQSELARRVGTHQSTISALVRRGARSSRHLFAIARELQTSPEYLTGVTDDPSNSPSPARADPGVTATCLLATALTLSLLESGCAETASRLIERFGEMTDGVFAGANARQIDVTLRLARELLQLPEGSPKK